MRSWFYSDKKVTSVENHLLVFFLQKLSGTGENWLIWFVRPALMIDGHGLLNGRNFQISFFFFCLFTGHWWWWLAEKANTFSVCSHLAGGKWIQSEVNSGLLKFNRCAIFRRIFVKLELIDSPWVDLQFWFWIWSYWMKRSAVKWRKRTLVRAFFVCHAASSWLTYDPTVSWIELHLQDVE